MPTNNIKTFTDRLVAQAKADPKKAVVLGVLLTVLGGMWVRMFGGSAGGPSHAVASVTGPYRAGGSLLSDKQRATGRDATAAALLEWQRRPITPVSRNLFVVNYDFFPQDGAAQVAAPVRVPQGDGFWDHIAKSMAHRADLKKEREVMVENLRQQAAKLKVQSTVMSATPKALINGELVAEGDVVASFRVSKIEARRIVVEREGIKLEIRSN